MTRNYGIPRPERVAIHMANVKHPERKIEPMERRWSARKALTFILGVSACCWAVFIVLYWWFS